MNVSSKILRINMNKSTYSLRVSLCENCSDIEFLRSLLSQVNPCIQSEYGKIQTRKISKFGHFSRNVLYRFMPLSSLYTLWKLYTPSENSQKTRDQWHQMGLKGHFFPYLLNDSTVCKMTGVIPNLTREICQEMQQTFPKL